MQAVKAALTVAHKYTSEHLTNALRTHVDTLGLTVVSSHPTRGLILECPRNSDRRLLRQVAHTNTELPFAQQLPPRQLWGSMPDGQHLLRLAARILVLQSVNTNRYDTEGIENVDVQVQSHYYWRKWLTTLNDNERLRLTIYRGGASWTPTRRHYNRDDSTVLDHGCPHCTEPLASLRHYWAECPRFNDLRNAYNEQYKLPDNWWRQQPRVTSKSGWITTSAATTPFLRATYQVAACRLGIAITADNPKFLNTLAPDDPNFIPRTP